MRKLLFILVLAALLVPVFTVSAAPPKNLVTMVASDDVNRAAMAIKFTHAAMKEKGYNATIFFNVYGVHLVDRNTPSPIYPSGESIHAMLAAFIKDGGSVMACPMCMKHVGGMTNADLIENVHAQKGGGLNAVTTPDTLVLNY